MAVTQLLQRVSIKAAQEAASSEQALSQLIDITQDTLDLDWAPACLEKAYRGLGEHAHADLIASACEGAETVNMQYPDGPSFYAVYSAITMHHPDRVAELAQQLARLPLDALAQLAPELLPTSIVRPVAYLQQHATSLVDFYRLAAAERQAVIAWWD